MLINTDLITIDPDLAAKVGLNGAVILQRIHCLLADQDPMPDGLNWLEINTEYMVKRWFPFWSSSTYIRAYNSLVRDSYLIEASNMLAGDTEKTYVTIDYRLLNLNTPKSKQVQPENPPLFEDFVESKPKKQKRTNPTYALAMLMMEVTQSDKNVVGKNQFLATAKKILSAGYTYDQVRDWYSSDGWWYLNTTKGKMGYPPTMFDIMNTVKQARTAESELAGNYQVL